MKRMKKTSVALLLCMVLLGGAVSVYAVDTLEYRFYRTLNLPIEENVLSAVTRKYALIPSAILTLEDCNCSTGYTTFIVRDAKTGAATTGGLYLSNTNRKDQTMNYLTAYQYEKIDMILYAKPSSGNTGYYVDGKWSPNGSYTY